MLTWEEAARLLQEMHDHALQTKSHCKGERVVRRRDRDANTDDRVPLLARSFWDSAC